jgi:DNA polymerase-3 subunit gamma/tau
MAYQVIARKWRPQSFHDLVGQEPIATTLLNALRSNRLPQALLFTGVRGTGKTSSARILAKSLRCPNAKDFVPCGVCRECEDIANGRSLDVIEIDGASNNGVDAIRELRDTVGYMPSSGKYKIYIIDEVHMLSTSAFNALLKTLEEPPAHVVFVMATTEAQKIPNTILSRCQRFDFRRIPSRKIAEHLQKICQSEGISVEPEAVWLIARQADGSMRDSQSLLDQVITFCGGGVTLTKAIEVLGLTDRTVLLDTLTGLVQRNVQATVDVIEKIFRAGYDPKVFAQDLLEEIRNALLVRLCQDDPTRVVDLPDVEIQSLLELTSPLGDEDIHMLFDMTLKGVSDILRSQDARIVLEMLLLRMAAAPRIASLQALASGELPSIPAVPATPAQAAAPTPPHLDAQAQMQAPATASQPQAAPTAPVAQDSQATTAPSSVAQIKPKYTMSSFVRPAPGANPAPPPKGAGSNGASNGAGHAPTMATAAAKSTAAAAPQTASQDEPAGAPIDPARANDPWFRFVEDVKKSNSLLGAMLENTHMIGIEGTRLSLGVPKKMSFLFDKVKDPDNIRRIESFVETFWDKKLRVDVKLADEAEKATPKVVQEERQAAQKRSVEHAVEQNPLVQTAQNVFKAQIKAIKDAPRGATKDTPRGATKDTPHGATKDVTKKT